MNARTTFVSQLVAICLALLVSVGCAVTQDEAPQAEQPPQVTVTLSDPGPVTLKAVADAGAEAWGHSAGNGDSALAVGKSAIWTEQDRLSTAIGTNAIAPSSDSTAIGYGSSMFTIGSAASILPSKITLGAGYFDMGALQEGGRILVEKDCRTLFTLHDVEACQGHLGDLESCDKETK